MQRDAAQAKAAQLRGLLLPQEHALRARARGALHHLPTRPARGPRPAAPAGPPHAPPALGDISGGVGRPFPIRAMRRSARARRVIDSWSPIGAESHHSALSGSRTAPAGYVLPHATTRSLRTDARRQLEPGHLREPAHDRLLAQRRRLLLRRAAAGRGQGRPRRGRASTRSGSRSAAASSRSSANGRSRRRRAASTSRSRSRPAPSVASSSSRSTSIPTAPRRPMRTACCGSSCRCATLPRPPGGCR